MSNLIKGTFILTLATIISKLLGFLYVVPFTALVGTQGYILFEYAYKPYVIILSLATMGVPLAVSKSVAKYNELGNPIVGVRLLKSGIVLLTITGTICFALLYYLAPSIASLLISDQDTSGNSIEDVVFVIRMVSFALIVVPPMGVVRGFFQGYQSMEPTAISQVLEQLVRLLFILIGAYFAIHMFGKSIPFAVGLSTFAAFVGAVAGLLVLLRYWQKKSPSIGLLIKESTSTEEVSLVSMYKELIAYMVPFVIVGLSIPLYQTIDTFTINGAMMKTGFNQLEAETVNSVVALVQKIIMIPVSLATAMALTLVPTITKSFVAKEWNLLKGQIANSFLIVFYLTLPIIVLLMALAAPSFSFLFGETHEVLGGSLMFWYAPTAMILALYLVTTAILQGIDRYKLLVVTLCVGLGFKLLTNYYFVFLIGGVGSALSTGIGFSLSIVLNIWAIKKYAHFSFASTYILMGKILGIAVLMGIFVGILDMGVSAISHSLFSNNFLDKGSRLLIGGVAGVLFFGFITYRTKLMHASIGEALLGKITEKLQGLVKKGKKRFRG